MIDTWFNDLQTEIRVPVEHLLSGLDQMKIDLSGVSGTAKPELDTPSGIDRVLSAAGAMLIFGGPGVALVGATMGYKEMLKSLGPQIGLCIGMVLLGVTNPWIIYAALIGGGVVQGWLKANSTTETLKLKIGEKMAMGLRDAADETGEKMANQVVERIDSFVQRIDCGLGKEIQAVREQVEAVLDAKKEGETQAQAKRQDLARCEAELKRLDAELTDVTFAVFEHARPAIHPGTSTQRLNDMGKTQPVTAAATSGNELLGEFKDLLAVTAREVSQAATVPALEAVFHQWNERLATLTQGLATLHAQTLADYRAWEGERRTALDVFREKLQQSQADLTKASACCRDTQAFLQGVRQQGEAALKTHGQLVEEFLRLAGERASQMAQAIDSAENWFKTQTSQWETMLLESDDKVNTLNQAVQQSTAQSAIQVKTWQDMLQRGQQALAQFSAAVQAAEERLARESSAWRTAVMETGEKVSRLTQVVEEAIPSFREGIATLEQQMRLQVQEQQTTSQTLGQAAETMKKAGDDFHRTMSAVVKKFHEICTNTSASFERSVQQSNATLGAVLAAVQDSNARLRAMEATLGRPERSSDSAVPAVIVEENDHRNSSHG